MKKLSLIIGALGGGMAGYLFSNKKLRDQLADAKDPEEAANLLGKHLQSDGKKLAKQIQDFVNSEDVQSNLKKAKEFAKQNVDYAKKEMNAAIGSTKKKVKSAAHKTKTAAKKTAKKTTKKTATAAKKKAKSTAKRVKAKVRKVGT